MLIVAIKVGAGAVDGPDAEIVEDDVDVAAQKVDKVEMDFERGSRAHGYYGTCRMGSKQC